MLKLALSVEDQNLKPQRLVVDEVSIEAPFWLTFKLQDVRCELVRVLDPVGRLVLCNE